MKLIRPCTYSPPGAPCPTHDNGTWPKECVCYQSAQSKRYFWNRLICWVGLLAFIWLLFALLMALSVKASSPCLTKSEAREKWPRSHLYWHSSDHCWDNHRGGSRHHYIKRDIDPTIRAQAIPSLVDPLIYNEIDAQADVPVPMLFPMDEATTFLPWEYRISGAFGQ